jgi:hypothetical protein
VKRPLSDRWAFFFGNPSIAEIDKVVTEHRKNAQIALGFYTPVIHGTASATACIFFVMRKR